MTLPLSDQLKVVFLGTGAAIPSLRRGLPSLAILREGEIFLCDCGEGTQLRLLQAGLPPSRVSTIFVSHLHGDHIFGLPGFLTTQQMTNRTAPLTIVGPVGLNRYLTALRRVTEFTIDYPLRVIELEAEKRHTLRISALRIRTAPLHHRMPCIGYRFEEAPRPGKFDVTRAEELGIPSGPLRGELVRGRTIRIDGRTIRPEQVVGRPIPGRVIAFCADTRPCEAATELAENADVLIHDSTFSDEHEDKARETFHSTAREAAHVARQANAHRLILYHISTRNDEEGEKKLLRQAREIFPATDLATDFMQIELSRRRPTEGQPHES